MAATSRHNSQIRAIRENWIAPTWWKFGYILFHKSQSEVILGELHGSLSQDEDPGWGGPHTLGKTNTGERAAQCFVVSQIFSLISKVIGRSECCNNNHYNPIFFSNFYFLLKSSKLQFAQQHLGSLVRRSWKSKVQDWDSHHSSVSF